MDKKDNLSIKQWAEEDRPREKLLAKGIQSLSNAELLAIIIGSGYKDESAVDVAKTILQKAQNNLNELSKLSVSDLIKNKGIGEAKAISIVATMELGRRRNHADSMIKPSITHSRDMFQIFHPLLCDLPHEEFWVAYLNRSNKIVAQERISTGGISGTVIDTKIIAKKAMNVLASGMVLCHNHPSGNKNPSEEDKKITVKIKQTGNLIDVRVLDHIIITETDYFSFADEGIL